jgi:hypothetical protein
MLPVDAPQSLDYSYSSLLSTPQLSQSLGAIDDEYGAVWLVTKITRNFYSTPSKTYRQFASE